MDRMRIDYRAWVIRVLAWDGALPVVIASAPFGVEALFPGRHDIMELTSICLPIVAFLIRLWAGNRHIQANGCGEGLRMLQVVVLFMAVLWGVMVDAMLLLAHEMPGGGGMFSVESLASWSVMVSVYLVMMTFAMYPGRTLPPHGPEDDPWRTSAFPD